MTFTERGRWMVAETWPLVALSLSLAVAVLLITTVGTEQTVLAATIMLIDIILVVGLYVFAGNSGVLSFGQISFMAIGAYTSALLTIPPSLKSILLLDLPPTIIQFEVGTIPATILSGLVAATIALLISVPLMRLSGIAASLATFAWLVIVHVILSNWDSVTRGTNAMTGVPTDTSIGATLVWSIATMAAAYAFQRSRYGLRLRASREDLIAAQAIGISVQVERMMAFTISGFLMGVGGALWAHLLGSFNPDAFYLNLAFLTIAMLVVGGINSLAGAVFGTVIVTLITQILSQVELGNLPPLSALAHPGLTQVGLALLMLAILIFRSEGITRGREFVWPIRSWLSTYVEPSDKRLAIRKEN
jgi:branched-chain amino acid transport system permease protein